MNNLKLKMIFNINKIIENKFQGQAKVDYINSFDEKFINSYCKNNKNNENKAKIIANLFHICKTSDEFLMRINNVIKLNKPIFNWVQKSNNYIN